MLEKFFGNKNKKEVIPESEAAWIKREFGTDNIAEVEEILRKQVEADQMRVEIIQE
jgi:hypothetical protein